MQERQSVKPGSIQTSNCMDCGAEMTEFVPEGRNQCQTCESCFEAKRLAFWAVWEEREEAS